MSLADFQGPQATPTLSVNVHNMKKPTEGGGIREEAKSWSNGGSSPMPWNPDLKQKILGAARGTVISIDVGRSDGAYR